MRAHEFIYEDQHRSQSIANDLLHVAKGNKASALNTAQLIRALNAQGIPATEGNIEQYLQQSGVVMNSTPDEVTLTPGGGAEQGTQDQDSASKVSDMAAKATAKSK